MVADIRDGDDVMCLITGRDSLSRLATNESGEDDAWRGLIFRLKGQGEGSIKKQK